MKIIKNKTLKAMNTFHLDVRADEYAEFSGVGDLREILRESASDKWYVLSGGSNTLFCGDYHGLVLHPVSKDIAVVEEDDSRVLVRVAAGMVWDDFVVYAVEKGWYGIENLSIIPGMVGAAPVQNIGAYGVEAKDAIDSVEVYLTDEEKVLTLHNQECMFGYRDSIFKNELKDRAIVLSVVFRLNKKFEPVLKYGDLAALAGEPGSFGAKELRDIIIKVRESKLPDHNMIGNGGSFFKNPVVSSDYAREILEKNPGMPHYEDKKGVKIPAGWLIEQAGWKGHRRGDAGVYEKQALVLVNHGTASPKEIIMLANDIIDDVRQKFGVIIAPEINMI